MTSPPDLFLFVFLFAFSLHSLCISPKKRVYLCALLCATLTLRSRFDLFFIALENSRSSHFALTSLSFFRDPKTPDLHCLSFVRSLFYSVRKLKILELRPSFVQASILGVRSELDRQNAPVWSFFEIALESPRTQNKALSLSRWIHDRINRPARVLSPRGPPGAFLI